MSQTMQTIYRQDYQQPPFWVDTIDLTVELGEEVTQVTSKVAYYRNPEQARLPLRLHGQKLTLVSIHLNDSPLTTADYSVDEQGLTLLNPPETFKLTIVTHIKPQENTELEGLYKSSGNFCTQCEAEGFRRITYYLDRPDVMAKFTTKIIADKSRYPVLLSNGNLVAKGELSDNRHWVLWQDPFKKPAYLFALVGGNLVCVADHYKTLSGREVVLQIFVQAGNEDKCQHALDSLKLAMKWDEEKFGLEYDLDIFMIVAVDDFNMGAMENKGLNVFNSKFVLANSKTATDTDYIYISLVVGHEYFHNWTGNRVTCRDWFQLSLKEGLTVFRDQEFVSDITSRDAHRVNNIVKLRNYQFPQDAGPLAHSVRPDSYIQINNFYTTTIYEKGAELIRMMQTIVGEAGFRRGMDLYFQRHDGQAVTCDDFAAAIADANQVDFSQLKLWYSQAGTPVLTVSSQYFPETAEYHLTIQQSLAATPGQPHKLPMHMPIKMGLLDAKTGEALPLQLKNTQETHHEMILNFTQVSQTFEFVNVTSKPLPSVLRDFSAPVKLNIDYREDELIFLWQHDKNNVNRWEAGQRLVLSLILRLINDVKAQKTLHLDEKFIQAFHAIMEDKQIDPYFKSRLLRFPSETTIAEMVAEIHPDIHRQVRHFLLATIAHSLSSQLMQAYQATRAQQPYSYTMSEVGRRDLNGFYLQLLAVLDTPEIAAMAYQQFKTADNMTDTMAALTALNDMQCPERQQALDEFYQTWQSNPLVMDKWFALQAMSVLPDTLDNIEKLLKHPGFNLKNPNKVKALLGSFSLHNLHYFHDVSGRGYQLLADAMIELEPLNPLITARMLEPLTRYQRLEAKRSELMKAQLQRIAKLPKLSSDVFEVIEKALSE
ncbi:MAG: aminopeptidase N [Legionellales bacterium]|nr:aminopeptidase N [Legionellales bacterium]